MRDGVDPADDSSSDKEPSLPLTPLAPQRRLASQPALSDRSATLLDHRSRSQDVRDDDSRSSGSRARRGLQDLGKTSSSNGGTQSVEDLDGAMDEAHEEDRAAGEASL